MKKKIIILGSTGSVGQNTIDILKKDKKNFEIILLSTQKNINKSRKSTSRATVESLETFYFIFTDLQKYILFIEKMI